jgi:hypothetical protein
MNSTPAAIPVRCTPLYTSTMLRNITKHIPLTTIIVSYFFICGGLYLIGFWATFNIDITNFVSLADIPKSFIVPFVVSQGFVLLNAATNTLATSEEIDNNPKEKKWEPNRWKRVLKWFVTADFILLLGIIIIVNFHSKYKLVPNYWLTSAVAFSYLLAFKVMTYNKIKELVQYYHLRLYLVSTIISIPFLSFAIGKSNSLKVYNNSEIKYITITKEANQNTKSDSSSLKFLGFLGDKLIGASLDNKKIIFINQSSFDRVQLDDTK